MTNQNSDGYVIGFPRAGLWKTRFNSDSYNRLERTLQVPGDADLRSLTILRKLVKLLRLPPLTLPHQGGGGVGSEKFYKSGRKIH